MNQSMQALERLAIDAHKQGIGWEQFWTEHGAQARALEPWSRQRFKRLVDRLLALLTSGDLAGMTAVGDDDPPWERDNDQAKPADVGTQARFDWNSLNAEVTR
jgi:hypothetical protein